MRKFINGIKVILRIFREHKLRSALSVLGIAFGAFALITMISVSEGMKEKNRREIEKFGKNPVIVKSGKVFVRRGRQRAITTSTTLKLREVQIIKHQIPYIKKAIPAYMIDYPVRNKGITVFTTIVGTKIEYLKYRNLTVKRGRFFNRNEEKSAAKVVVLGSKIAEKFFGNEDPVGKNILIFRVPCKVIGVLEEKGVDLAGVDQDLLIYTPLKTAMRRLANVDYINTIYIEVDRQENIPFVKSQLISLLRKLHHIKPGERNDFTVLTADDILRMQNEAIRIFTILGSISAVISFVIGGIGILSIMILIVNERIEEIGIRRAVGATRKDIIFQFLTESGFISFTGSVLGVLSGISVSFVISVLINIPYTIIYHYLIFTFFSSIIIGISAGMYPAFKASSINPVSALRRT
ncbi:MULTISPECIES: ABC transporter permease [Persephonella]|uniref:Macrolide export ATP-binding/permease protein MacB n=1 Tax=Persephonella marina (strain DSM 14350 / EX-H1) TaxID=123214 RepID=C0QRF7_PERMH|nr:MULTISPECIES: ABC transporter permease [Persephonella]ACO03227.1 macrolide export ATP-binding/permease protein MacB [Persephonella marina EX-H1]